MITRSKLVEQLREHQLRSQHKWDKLTIFSPQPRITSRGDILVALSWASLLSVLFIFAFAALYFRYIRTSVVTNCLGTLLLICLKISRQRKLTKLRKRRMLLPLSM